MGFIPGITGNYGAMTFAGHVRAPCFLEFSKYSSCTILSICCSARPIFYLARTGRMARGYLIGGGAPYLVLWIYGLITSSNMAAAFVPMNSADNWPHLILGVAMIGLGLWLGRDATEEAKGSTT